VRVDLEAELFSAAGRVRQPHLDRLRALGVSSSTIARLGACHPPFGVVEAEAMSNGTYLPGEGEPHIVQPVFQDGDLIDLVAWRSADPSRWWSRTGLGWIIGHDGPLTGGWVDDDGLTMHSTPLDWLRSGAAGVCVVDWDAEEVEWLRCFSTIRCDSQSLAAVLRRRLSRPRPLPRIATMEVRHAA